MSASTLVFELRASSTQELLIEAAGEDVLNLVGRGGDPNDDMQMPDWVDAITRAANLGMFGGARHAPWQSSARVIENTFVRLERRNRWRVTLDAVDPGVARVLVTLLRARELDAATVATLDAPPGAPYLRLADVAFPGRYHALPFPVDQEGRVRSNRDRAIRIEFAEPPDDMLDERAMKAMELWGNLLILGAYARPDLDPREAATLPDGAFWEDEVTLAQTFDEAFDSDDAAFDAMINWAARLHHGGTAVRAVRVR